MSTYRVSELEGALLDAAVAKANGWERRAVLGIEGWYEGDWIHSQFVENYRPSHDWYSGGPIIEREEICADVVGEKISDYHWQAEHDEGLHYGYGKTFLIAAMRCYVRSKLGDTVDLP